MFYKLEQVDDECTKIDGVIVYQGIDGIFRIFKSVHDYKCYTYDDYKDWDKPHNQPIQSFSELYDLLDYIRSVEK